jgi:hypothetical protein
MLTILPFIAIIFIIYITFFIGWKVGNGVQDEVVPARKYLIFGMDALLAISVGLALYSYGQMWLAIGVPVVLVVLRRWLAIAYAPVAGIVAAAATLLPAGTQATVYTLLLVLAFLQGVTTKKLKLLLQRSAWMPMTALPLYAALTFF